MLDVLIISKFSDRIVPASIYPQQAHYKSSDDDNDENDIVMEMTEEKNNHFFPPQHYNRFTALFWDHPGESMPEENFWISRCKED